MQQSVLIVDDEIGVRESLSLILSSEGYDTITAGGAADALKIIDKGNSFDFIISDIRMPEMDGLGFIRELKTREINSNLIMISAYGNLETSIEAIKHGASDYINKPINSEELILRMKLLEEKERLKEENTVLKRQLREKKGFSKIVFTSEVMKSVIDFASRIAEYKTTVLITGESGTGKEILAHSIHQLSPRKDGPFVAVNCAAIPDTLIESELFGYAKGAFTGATSTKEGLFEVANSGTIFLDEIGEFPLHLQPKLLRILQEEEIRRLGETQNRKIDVRVMAATSRDLSERVKMGEFREDLFYRLNVVPIRIPPLRERKEDIPILVDHFIQKHNEKLNKQVQGISSELMAELAKHSWPGNIRELENLLERSIILTDSNIIEMAELPLSNAAAKGGLQIDTLDLTEAWKILETDLIEKALKESGGNRTHSAKLLGISRRALLYKMKDYEIS